VREGIKSIAARMWQYFAVENCHERYFLEGKVLTAFLRLLLSIPFIFQPTEQLWAWP